MDISISVAIGNFAPVVLTVSRFSLECCARAQIEWGGVVALPAPGRSALNLLFTLKMLAIWSTY